jgi:hypothetical protein
VLELGRESRQELYRQVWCEAVSGGGKAGVRHIQYISS